MSKLWLPDIFKGDVPLYLSLLNALERDIVSGELRPGDRLPTHRELASQLGLAVGTVTKALTEAQRRGLIDGDGRRGTFVKRHPTRPEVLLPSLSPDSTIIDLSPYYPPAETDPDLSHALSQLATRGVGYLIHYTGPRGYAHHRAAGADWVTNLGLKTTEDKIIITAGAQHAILTTFMAVGSRGDTVATQKHTYPGIKWVCDLLKLNLVGVEADSDGLLPDAFEDCCRKQKVRFLYCISTLHNPTNATLSESRRRALVEVAEKYDVKIIEDEINRRLVEKPPPLISSMAPDRSYLVASLAKVVAGGLRICYLVAPDQSRDRIYRAILGTTLMVSPLLAELAALWLGDGTAERTVTRKRTEARKRTGLADECLTGLEYYSDPCSYFLWLKLPGQWTPGEFARATQKEGVIVAPSDIFAVDPARADCAARICLGGNADKDTLRRGLQIVRSVVQGSSRPDSAVF